MKNKLVICASASLEKEILLWKNKLESYGYNVIKYPEKIMSDLREGYPAEFSNHYKAILKTDVLLALNLERKKIPGYIGPAVFAEIAFAIGLNKTRKKQIEIYYLNPIPVKIFPYSDELELWRELNWIRIFDKNLLQDTQNQL